jgi:adenylate cyclase class IV
VTVADELELKAVIPDPDALRERLRASGGRERFRARMADRRFDRAGELVARGEVLRVRSAPSAGSAASPHAFLASLGYDVVHAVDRDVEVYDVGGATVRATGIGRDAFTADSLADFVRRFEARTGRPAVLAAS